MKIEDRLHDAMHEYADRIEPEPGSWTRITARFDDAPSPRRPARRPLVLAGVALALVVVLLAALVVRDDGDEARVVTDPSAIAAMPSRILAITVAGQPVVLDAKTSQRVSGSTGIADIGEGTQVAVLPNATAAYVVGGDRDRGCVDTSIRRFTLGAEIGPAEPVVADRAKSPTVSPDGRYLAYLRCSPGDARAREIVLRDLTTGISAGAGVLETVTPAPAGAYFVDRLEFAADSRHIQYRLVGDAVERMHEIDIVAGEPAPGRAVDVVPAGELWVGVRGATGEVFAWGDASRGVAVSAVSASSDRRLFTLPGIPHQVMSDRSGRHILALVGDDLFRWSEGDREPTKLDGNYIAAAWIPDGPVTPPPVVPANLPNGVLVASNGGGLKMLGATTGQQHSTFGAGLNVSGLSLTPNGRKVVFATGSPGCRDNGGQISSIDPGTEQITRIIAGASSPVVSPDGKWLAYGTRCATTMLGLTNLETGAKSLGDPIGRTTGEGPSDLTWVAPLAWSPDSTRLLLDIGHVGDQNPHYYVNRLITPNRSEVTELPGGPDVTAVTFIDDGTVALAESAGAGSDVKSWKIGLARPEQLPSVLFSIDQRVTVLVADRTGTHFLAVTAANDLYRWSRGDTRPTKLAEDVIAAAWSPWS